MSTGSGDLLQLQWPCLPPSHCRWTTGSHAMLWCMYRLAQYVLSRVDPTETFLKSIPRHPQSLLVNYPVSAFDPGSLILG
jgi:hypothetical protein